MLKINTNTNKFYIAVSLTLLILIVYSVFIARNIFFLMSKAEDVNPEILNAPSPHLNTQNIDKAYIDLFERTFIGLDLRE